MKARRWSCAVAMAAFLPFAAFAQEQPQAAKLVPALGWDSATQGLFVTSVAVDAQNNVWAGTEGKGLWEYDSGTKKWRQFTSKEGLGDDFIYAVAVDKLGRVWAGHLNHGVSVWNGEKWKNYDLLNGPLGDRVFAIATCPTDGDVWIATDCGVARYSFAKDDWDYFTRASGLPSNQIQSVAFNSKGDIILGTQCDGIATATAADQYKKWKLVGGPLQMPGEMFGDGLPSSIINEVVSMDIPQLQGADVILAATPAGMGMAANGEWKYMRGRDWKANVQGLYAPPDNSGPPAVSPPESLRAEDWITCIRQDEKSKNVWIGYRTKGLEVRGVDMDDGATLTVGGDSDAYFVRAICLPQNGPPLVAVSDVKVGGLLTLDNSTAGLQPGPEPPKTLPAFPGTPKPADAATLSAITKQLDVFKNVMKPGEAAFFGDDWRTGGDWVGRYGGSLALLCGLDTGYYQLEQDFEATVSIGPHNKAGSTNPGQYVAHDTTDSRRALYSPSLGHRVEAESNDFSNNRDTYPPDWEGPDLWVDVKVPAGVHCLSLYFVNNDEQSGTENAYNKLRDYDLQVLAWNDSRDVIQKSQPLARARVTDFAGGVYKEFIVAGPARFVVRVGRDRSFCTKLQGVFIDRLLPEGVAENRKELPGFDSIDFGPDTDDKPASNADAILTSASTLWDLLDKSFDKRALTGLQLPLRIAAYRAAVADKAPETILTGWRWQMGVWTQEDRDAFDKAMADAFKAYSTKAGPDDQ